MSSGRGKTTKRGRIAFTCGKCSAREAVFHGLNRRAIPFNLVTKWRRKPPLPDGTVRTLAAMMENITA